MQKILRCCLATLLLAGIVSPSFAGDDKAGSDKRIVKWIDTRGVTHYGDKLPAQEAGRDNTEMTKQGIVVKSHVQRSQTVASEDQEKLAQQHQDAILLASYTNAEEIDLARARNLELNQATLQALSIQKENVNARLQRNVQSADRWTKKEQPVPDYLAKEIELAKAESSKLDQQIAAREAAMQVINTRYADEKSRFIAIKAAKAHD